MTDLLRSLGAHDRVAALGIAALALSLLLPWYGATFAGGVVKTALGTFGFVEAAIVLTAGAAGYLLARATAGHDLPRPLHTGTVVAAAGAWIAVLIGYRMLDRPEFDFGYFHVPANLRYGIFVALGGAALIVIGGLRRRREEIAGDRARRGGKEVGE